MPLKYQADRILVRCPNWVGDAVMATPALRCMRRNYKALEHAPWFDRAIEYRPPRGRGPVGWVRDAAGLLSLALRLRRERFDMALLLTPSFRAALIARLSGARRRVANSHGDQSWLLTDALPWPREDGKRVPLPKVEAYMRLCEHLGCEGVEDRKQELFFSDADARRADELLRSAGADPDEPIFGLAPGAAYGPSKLWNSRKFAEVGDAIAEKRGWRAALLCGPGEDALGDEISAAMARPPLRFDPVEFSLDALKPMVSRCRLLVATDSGVRHFGVAFGTPTVVIMGPTDPRHTQSDYADTVILRQDVPCGPCHLRVCPRDHECMERISAGMVVDAAERLLARIAAQAAV